MAELLPCPKCSEKPWTHQMHNLNTTRFLIQCETEGCPELGVGMAPTEAEAIALWNACSADARSRR